MAATAILALASDVKNRQWIREILTYVGYDVEDQPVEAPIAKDYHLIIIDASDGDLSIVRRVRKEVGTIPILVMTDGPTDPGPAIEAGATGLVSKPLSLRKILGTVRGLIHRAPPSRESRGGHRRMLMQF